MEGSGQKSNGNVTVFGVSTCSLLGILFVALKLCGVIDWSWWWVTCPFWAGCAVFVGIFVILLIIAGFLTMLEAISTAACKKRQLGRRRTK